MSVDLEKIISDRNASNAVIRRQTLRDEFAGKAMQSLITVWNPVPTTTTLDPDDLAALALNAYIIADAMLEAKDLTTN